MQTVSFPDSKKYTHSRWRIPGTVITQWGSNPSQGSSRNFHATINRFPAGEHGGAGQSDSLPTFEDHPASRIQMSEQTPCEMMKRRTERTTWSFDKILSATYCNLVPGIDWTGSASSFTEENLLFHTLRGTPCVDHAARVRPFSSAAMIPTCETSPQASPSMLLLLLLSFKSFSHICDTYVSLVP